jgi:putative transposase
MWNIRFKMENELPPKDNPPRTICSGEKAPGARSRIGVRRSQRGWYSRGYLPHFNAPQAIQHITYRLADSLPLSVLKKLRSEVETTIQSENQRKSEIRQRIEDYLDSGHGACLLKEPRIANCIVENWQHFDGKRYRLLAWVVMPNHCHVLIELHNGVPISKIVLSWKNYTARAINRLTEAPGFTGRTGVRRSQGKPIWQRDYWDRYIRDRRHFERAREYIINNPVKAGLVSKPDEWRWSSAAEPAGTSLVPG